MSRDPADSDFQTPRRPRPSSGTPGKARPGADPDDAFGESSAFRPNPSARDASSARSGSANAGGSRKRSSASADSVAPGPKWWERIIFGRVSSGQLAQFCRQFASYLQSGVDYNRTLTGLQKQFAMTALGPAIERMNQRIKAGSTLEEAMSREKKIFGTMFLSMIKVAETRGGVPETLRILANHYEARQRLIRQSRSAMIYPIIVLIIAGGVVALITIFLLPMFAAMLQDISRKSQLPWASRALLSFSWFIGIMGWWLLPLIAIGVPVLLIQFYKTSAGKAVIDRLLLSLPGLGSLFRKLDTSRFARTMATLLDAGVGIGESIELTAHVLNMSPMRQAVRDSRDKVMAGKDLSAALADSRQFPPDVLAVLESGEETGKIPESLTHLADDYEEQVTLMVKNMGSLIQPLLMLMLGGLVLFIILAVFLPYIQMLTSLAGP